MTDNPNNHSETGDEQMIGHVVRVIHDGAQWGPTASSEQNVLVTLAANGGYDPESVREAFDEAADRGLITEMSDGWIPSGEYEKYLRPNTVGSEVRS